MRHGKGWHPIFLVLLASVPGGPRGAAAEEGQPKSRQRPHVVLCMADDQGWGDVGFRGEPFIRTPTLDAMARDGLRFDRFYAAAPVCSPTRASVLTGRHPNRMGCFSWGHTLRPQEVTLAEALRGAGYATGHFGKWHLGSVRADSPISPGASGFEEWFSSPNFFDLDPTFSHNGRAVETRGEGSRVVVDAALEWMGRQVSEGRPMLSVIWFGSPHVPHQATPAALAAQADAPAKRRAFLAEMAELDAAMGTLRAGLRRLGIADDTLLWFCSDNGAIAEGSTGGLRGGKGNLSEGGIRVPAMIEWPAVVGRGRIVEEPCTTSDIYPTILDLAGVTVPNQPVLDGRSLRDLLEGTGSDALANRGLGFWHYRPAPGIKCDSRQLMALQLAEERGDVPASPAHDRDAGRIVPVPPDRRLGQAAWIEGPWKLLVEASGTAAETRALYDLSVDPGERADLAAAEPQRAEAMARRLVAWQRSVIASCNGGDYPDADSADDRAVAPEPGGRPNVLLVISDDQGYGDLGCYGSDTVRTPQLDRLAAAGVRLTNFYVASPACTPSRASLFTGRYPQRHGITAMIRNEAPDYGHRYTPEEYEVTFERVAGLDEREVLLSEHLTRAGYRCGMVGKWDFGSQRRFLPRARGFDRFYGFVNTGIDYFTHERYGVPSMVRDDQPTTEDRGTYTTDLFLREALRFLDDHRADPFFLCVAFNAPHSGSNLDPLIRSAAQSTAEYRAEYPDLAAQAGERDGMAYGKPARVPNHAARRLHELAAISQMDAAIGTLLDRLVELGLAERTLVIFLSDNGGAGTADNGPFRGRKSQLHEGGVRVPAIVTWPGMLPAGEVRDGMATALDLVPTVLAACRVPLPDVPTIDGIDLLPWLQGDSPSPRNSMFWRWRRLSAARVGCWKWLATPDGESLFDLDRDPGETTDLAVARPEDAARLREAFAAWTALMEASEPREPFRDH
jgi:arylsulfatase A